MIKGKELSHGLDKILAEKYGISHLSEREQILFLLGMRMGNVATEHIIRHNIPQTGSVTSYNYIMQCKDLYCKDICFEGGYYWQKLKSFG